MTMSWITEHWQELGTAYLSLVGFASIVVKLTPTQKDDEVLGKIIGFVSKWLALNPEKK